jgi:hypothetical protein
VTSPIAVGYIRIHLLMTEQELDDTKERLAHFAATRGYHLSAVFAERPDSVPAAFIELITAVNRYRADAVVLPGRPPASRSPRTATADHPPPAGPHRRPGPRRRRSE